MDIHPTRTDADYQATLKEVSGLIDLDPALDSPEGERLDILATLVEAYERKHFPIDLPDPIESIKFRMEQGGLTIADMKPYLGNANRAYEVLNRKRGLSLAMIRRLHRGLHIPAEVLIAD